MAEHPELDLPAGLLADGFDRVQENVHRVLDGLEPDALTWRVTPEANPIGWLVWHLSRVLDDHVFGLAAELGLSGTDQVWTSDAWYERFGLPYPAEDHGYGQSSDDVAAFSASAADLLGYHDAVHAHVLDVLGQLKADHYRAIVDTRWTPHVTAAVRLVSVLDDAAQHIGQAAYVKGCYLSTRD